MNGEASTVTLEMLLKILDIIKVAVQNRGNRNWGNNKKEKNVKQPKVKFGKIKLNEYKEMLSKGIQFNTIDVNSADVQQLERFAKEVGAQFAEIHIGNDNTATIAVEPKYFAQMNKAIELLAKSKIKEETVTVKEGKQLIDAEDVDFVKESLKYYDIPAYSFINHDGKCMNIVPKEFDGQYEAAVESAIKLKNNVKNISVVRFEQTGKLDSLSQLAEVASDSQAQYIASKAKAMDIKVEFVKSDDKTVLIYPINKEQDIEKIKNDWLSQTNEKEKHLIAIVDRGITINKKSLLVREDATSFFTRVPNTAGKDYIRINKDDCTITNNGKTISLQLDYNKSYDILDGSGNIKASRKGDELAVAYNTKNQIGTKNATVSQYYNDNIERIEIFNAEKNTLLRIGMESADRVKDALIKEEINPAVAAELIKDIYTQLPDEYKNKFNYTPEKTEIVYSDVPNIGAIVAQTELSRAVIGMDEVNAEDTVGTKCCVLDRNTNKYIVLPVLPKNELSEKLIDMGYDKLKANVVADKIIATYSEQDKADLKVSHEETVSKLDEHFFSNKNAELNNLSYVIQNESITIFQKNGDEYKYADIEKGATREEVESALLKGFMVKDSLSVAYAVNQIDSIGILEKPNKVNVSGIDIAKMTSEVISLEKDGVSILMPKSNIDAQKISDTFGLSLENSEKFARDVGSSLKKVEKNKDKSLGKLVSIAKDKISSVKGTIKEKAVEKTVNTKTTER